MAAESSILSFIAMISMKSAEECSGSSGLAGRLRRREGGLRGGLVAPRPFSPATLRLPLPERPPSRLEGPRLGVKLPPQAKKPSRSLSAGPCGEGTHIQTWGGLNSNEDSENKHRGTRNKLIIGQSQKHAFLSARRSSTS